MKRADKSTTHIKAFEADIHWEHKHRDVGMLKLLSGRYTRADMVDADE